jgi:nanoRNase/pAp phosphatase (c-di-AMP/oligoRNAs hydrolase)
MRTIDVFNGDADGLCALHQLRLAQPADSELVTGRKREIGLLARVSAGPEACVTVLDVALDRNRAALDRLLAAGARVRYFDHHRAERPPSHPRLELHVDGAADTCTSLIVDRLLGGRCARWALVGAYGDNLTAVADQRAQALGLAAGHAAQLAELGAALNYNAYGERDADLAIHPRDLYLRLRPFADPFAFIAAEPIVPLLIAHRRADLARAAGLVPTESEARYAVYELPDAPWARRVQGTFAHQLARSQPQRAHAVLRVRADGGYAVSLRAPLARPAGADALARRFGGGGRAGAAGIDALPAERRSELITALRTAWSGDGA